MSNSKASAEIRTGATAGIDDVALVERLRSRDRAAFSELLNRYHASLRRMARMYVPSDAVADEVVQETWLGVLRGLATFEGRSSVKTWLFRILVNRAKTRGARESRTVPFSSTDTDDEPGIAVDPSRFGPNQMWTMPPARWEDGTPEKLLGDRQAVAFVHRAIAELPPKQRIVLTLRDIEGFDAEEVCSMLELTENHQRVLLHRGRSKVRSELERYLGEAERC